MDEALAHGEIAAGAAVRPARGGAALKAGYADAGRRPRPASRRGSRRSTGAAPGRRLAARKARDGPRGRRTQGIYRRNVFPEMNVDLGHLSEQHRAHGLPRLLPLPRRQPQVEGREDDPPGLRALPQDGVATDGRPSAAVAAAVARLPPPASARPGDRSGRSPRCPVAGSDTAAPGPDSSPGRWPPSACANSHQGLLVPPSRLRRNAPEYWITPRGWCRAPGVWSGRHSRKMVFETRRPWLLRSDRSRSECDGFCSRAPAHPAGIPIAGAAAGISTVVRSGREPGVRHRWTP